MDSKKRIRLQHAKSKEAKEITSICSDSINQVIMQYLKAGSP
jgi:hypothetical protein